VAGMVGLEEKIRRADLVITGEGKIDGQTRFGKVPFGVARLAAGAHKPVIAVTGSMESGSEGLYTEGITAVFPVIERPMTLEQALRHARGMVERTGERIARTLSIRC
ncbi:MAG TPA: glycerate kinase, partial [Bacteroides sp.]|nr:glycerate kinase [Bacteroides sp.]